MRKIISIIALVLILILMTLSLAGCTLQIETSENSVSASVDGDTTEKVDNIIDWIKARLSRLFDTSDSAKNPETTSSSTTTNI